MNSTNKAANPNIKLHYEGDSFFDALIAAIDQAKEEVLFEVYIYDLDELGERVFQSLVRAKSRGVRVQLLVDGLGSYFSCKALADRCQTQGIDFRVFHPTFAQRLMSLSTWASPLASFRLLNNRDHRKITLIDGHILFMGSMNVTRVHLRSLSGMFAWRDTGVQYVSERSLYQIKRSFRMTWLRSKGLRRLLLPTLRRVKPDRESFKKMKTSRFRLNDGFRQRIWLWKDLKRRVRRAERRILVNNAYFLPKASLLRNLRTAARRGAFVGICIPFKTDVWIVREAGRVMLRKLLLDGVRVYEYQPSMMHAKTMVIDDWATVGSYNLNHRSLFHDLEVDFVLREKEQIDDLVKQWDKDIGNSHLITLAELDQDTWARRLLGRLLYLLRYWM